MQIIKKHQSNFDFVAQYAGDMNSLFDFAINNGVSITHTPDPGTELEIEPVNQRVGRYFFNTGIVIATGDLPNEQVPQIGGGIGFMRIHDPAAERRVDFVVS